jgi:DNA adenine methylase
MSPTRPLIRYHGGKWKLSDWIISRFPPHRVYVEPPYVAAARDGGDDYLHEMNDDDHEELAVFLRGLRGMVVVSGYHSALYDRLFDGWVREEREAFADGARPRLEVLWFNDAAVKALRAQETQMDLLEAA